MLVRLLSIFFALVLAISALKCQSGFYVKVGPAPAFVDNATSITCANTVKACIKEKIWATGQSGNTVAAIRYDCDAANQCSANYMGAAQNCNKPFDLYIGDMCCCTTDNCNKDVDLSAGSSLSIVIPISFLLFLFSN